MTARKFKIGQSVRLRSTVQARQAEAGFTSSLPGFFFNHFDLGQASAFPVLPGADSMPAWVDLVLRLSKAPFISIASIRAVRT
jgi:hypothetical protein